MKTYRVVVTNKADCDMDEIFKYISITLSSPNAAPNLVSLLYNSMQSLSTAPFIYPLARDDYLAKQGFHVLFVNNYIVFYVVDESENQVIIHRVLYAKRNYLQLFKNDDFNE